jgi:hypothetical protein
MQDAVETVGISAPQKRRPATPGPLQAAALHLPQAK